MPDRSFPLMRTRSLTRGDRNIKGYGRAARLLERNSKSSTELCISDEDVRPTKRSKQHILSPVAENGRTAPLYPVRQKLPPSPHKRFVVHDDDSQNRLKRKRAISVDSEPEESKVKEEESEEELGDPDDQFYLNDATASQLQRLRKMKLVQLVALLEDSEEEEANEMTKDALVALITSSRSDIFPARTLRSSSMVDVRPSDVLPPLRRAHTRSASLAELSGLSINAGTRLRNGKMRNSLDLSQSQTRGFAALTLSDEESEEEEELREVRPLPRRRERCLRNGKVVKVDEGEISIDQVDPAALPEEEESSEEEEEEVGEMDISIVENALNDDADSESEEDEEADEPEIDLRQESLKSLLRLKRDTLVALCVKHRLKEQTLKKDLAQSLLDWSAQQIEDEEYENDISFRPADLSLDDSGDSAASSSGSDEDSDPDSQATQRIPSARTRKAREETKTQALAKVDTVVPTKARKPLLLDSHRPSRKARPEAPIEEEEEEEEVVATLDLESLNLQDKAIAPDQLIKGEKIGSGGFKDVYRGKYRNVRVAIADIRSHLTENEIKELGLLRDLRHENIVKLIGVVAYDETSDIPCSLVTELCMNGDLFDFIRSDAPVPSLDKVLKIAVDVAKGLDYLHNRTPKIIHRDMKSSNVLITARGVAKITDFGLARVKNTTRSVIKSLVGTVNWQAPELWVPHPRYNEKVDCYAAGLIIWETLQWHHQTKKYPFEGMNEHAIYQEVGQKNFRPSTSGMTRQWGPDILALVNRMWSQAPSERPSMAEVLIELQRMLAVRKRS